MNLEDFTKKSGFKVLAMARLNSCEYSLVLYLMNCAASGLDFLITTESELESLIGYDGVALREALDNLNRRGIIRLHYSDNVGNDRPSLRVGMQFNTQRWHLDYGQDATPHDAIVFPFRRHGQNPFMLLDGDKGKRAQSKDKNPNTATWRRVFNSFINGRSLGETELEQAEIDAKVLVETHPVDQVLLMIRHFVTRIPTLSLLASSWQHFTELYETENHRVDMLEARQKHKEFDDKLRDAAQRFLETSSGQELNEEERTVLNIILKHRYPRRQLFWAYQSRSRYPHLGPFFADNAPLMLPVTSSGAIVKRLTPVENEDQDN